MKYLHSTKSERKQSYYPQLKYRDIPQSSKEARALIPYETALRFEVLPLELCKFSKTPELLVLAAEGHDPQLKKQLEFSCDCRIKILTAPLEVLQAQLLAAYNVSAIAETETTQQTASCKDRSLGGLPALGTPAAILKGILALGAARNATDLHLEPGPQGYLIRLRVDGSLQLANVAPINPQVASQILRQLKVSAGLDITSRRACQDGSLSFEDGALSLRLRLSFAKQFGGEKVAIRLLPGPSSPEGFTTLEGLGIDQTGLQLIYSAVSRRRGAIILSGPTGSGKSTLLYSLLCACFTAQQNIVTLEDPIERAFAGINQIEVNAAAGDDFGHLLKKVLRQDPDIIGIGEIRDDSTATTAIHAAQSGHLVVASLHAGSCLEAVRRLERFGCNRADVLSCLTLVLNQRLLPRLCPNCKRKVEVHSHIRQYFEIPEGYPLFEAFGCARCNQSGRQGLCLAYELLLPVADVLKNLEENAQNASARLGPNRGYMSLTASIRRLVLAGTVAHTELLQSG